MLNKNVLVAFISEIHELKSVKINDRNGPVNAQMRSAIYIYQYTCLNIMVFSCSAGADEALGPCFSEKSVFSPFAYLMQVIPFKWHLNSFSHSNTKATLY